MKRTSGIWWTILTKYLQKSKAAVGGGSARRKSLELVNSMAMGNKRKGISNVTNVRPRPP